MSNPNWFGIHVQLAAVAEHVEFVKHPMHVFEQSPPPPPENWKLFAGKQNPHFPSGIWLPPAVWNSHTRLLAPAVLFVSSHCVLATLSDDHAVVPFFSHDLQFVSHESLENPNSHTSLLLNTPVVSMYDFDTQFPPANLHFVSSFIASNVPLPVLNMLSNCGVHLLLENLHGAP